jgi:hypothetical protein
MTRDIEMLLLKLADGSRVLRFSEPQSGLCREKRLENQESIARQMQRWMDVFIAVLERELGATG